MGNTETLEIKKMQLEGRGKNRFISVVGNLRLG